MKVATLLTKVQIGLITYKQLVAAIAGTDSRGINLVAVSQVDAVEVTAYQYCY